MRKSYDDAVKLAEEKGWNLDDYFIETSEQTIEDRNQMTDKQWDLMRFGGELI